MRGLNDALRPVVMAACLASVTVSGAAIAAEQLPEITIQGSRLIKITDRARQPGHPLSETLSLSRAVGYADLDVSTVSGAKELESRIAASAKALCDELDKLSPIGQGEVTCVKRSFDSAKKQFDLAIKAAEQVRAAGR